MTSLRFPRDFLWGVATSAYQVEGGNDLNDWWDWERNPNGGCVEACGDACDHYNRFEDDIALFARLGFDTYRFSLEWSRIQPEPDVFDVAEVDHYKRVLEACHAHGIKPIVTFHHFTSPRWLAQRGGWENHDAPELFAAFCAVAAKDLGDLFDIAVTINEPNMPPLLGYEDGVFPPGKRDPEARLAVTEHFLEAHRLARDAIRAQGQAEIGLALAITDWHAVDDGDETLEQIRGLREDIFLHEAAADDFIGVNAYTRHEVGPEGIRRPASQAELTALGWEYWPDALEATVRRAWQYTRGKRIIVTENGIGTDDDHQRIAYVGAALRGLHRCLRDGIAVRGYVYWSAFDNFEWNHGHGPRFGLIEVDRHDHARRVKPSGYWLGSVARRGELPLEDGGSR